MIFLPDDISVDKDTVQYKTSLCDKPCVADNAVDRNIQTCTKMEDILELPRPIRVPGGM